MQLGSPILYTSICDHRKMCTVDAFATIYTYLPPPLWLLILTVAIPLHADRLVRVFLEAYTYIYKDKPKIQSMPSTLDVPEPDVKGTEQLIESTEQLTMDTYQL